MTSRSFEVLLGDRTVGWLAERDDGRIGFRFSDAYRSLEYRPVLSQSFEDDLERTYMSKLPGQLPAFFANLLFEGRLRGLIEANLGIADGDSLGLLVAVGHDLPGAVVVRASTTEAPLMDGATDCDDDRAVDGDFADGLRFSLAGVQLKFSMVGDNERLTLPAHGLLGSWIVKVGSSEYPGLAENEWAMLEWARRAGHSVPECRLYAREAIPAIQKYVPIGSNVFAIRRYDREREKRIHQEDFAQVIGLLPERKYDETYERLGMLIRAVAGDGAFEEFVRRLSFIIASANNDAHLKNWSLVYKDQMTPELAPLYDQVATVAWPRLDRRMALKFASARDFGRVNLDSFKRMARTAGADAEQVASIAKGHLALLREKWPRLLEMDVLPKDHIEPLREHWKRVPLLREVGALP
jgi:serine/threonine-protein kinase HipA